MNARFFRWAITLFIAGVATASMAGCGQKKKDDGPTCRQIVTYMMRIRELGTFDERGAIDECRKQKWSAKQRKCLYNAKSIDAMADCVPKIQIQNPSKGTLPMPEWHPPVEQPIETGPDRLKREAAEKAAAEAAAAEAAGKPLPEPAPMPAPDSKPAPESKPAPAAKQPAPAPAKAM